MKVEDLREAARRLRAEFHVEVKDVQAQDDDLVIRGFASTPDIDRFGDIVEVDAFKGSINSYMQNGVVLLHHNHEIVVGKPKGYDLNQKGFEFEANIIGGLAPTDIHEQTKHEVKKGLLRALSIGFRILKDERAKNEGAQRRITDLELFEISVVSVPANRSTMFNVVKGFTLGSDSPEDLYRRGLPYGPLDHKFVPANFEIEEVSMNGDEVADERLSAARLRIAMARRERR